MDKYLKFSDFAEKVSSFVGDKKKIEDILDQNILIIDFKIKPSKQRQNTFYTTIQFQIDNIKYIIFTGSKVLTDQLEKYKDKLPFNTIIKKIDKYYTFS